jgi:hypothetical protein
MFETTCDAEQGKSHRRECEGHNSTPPARLIAIVQFENYWRVQQSYRPRGADANRMTLRSRREIDADARRKVERKHDIVSPGINYNPLTFYVGRTDHINEDDGLRTKQAATE